MAIPLMLVGTILLFIGYLLWIRKRVDLLAGMDSSVKADKNRLGTLTGLPLFIIGFVLTTFATLVHFGFIPGKWQGWILAGIAATGILAVFYATFSSGKYLYPPEK